MHKRDAALVLVPLRSGHQPGSWKNPHSPEAVLPPPRTLPCCQSPRVLLTCRYLQDQTTQTEVESGVFHFQGMNVLNIWWSILLAWKVAWNCLSTCQIPESTPGGHDSGSWTRMQGKKRSQTPQHPWAINLAWYWLSVKSGTQWFTQVPAVVSFLNCWAHFAP